jgi:hypothetical protein
MKLLKSSFVLAAILAAASLSAAPVSVQPVQAFPGTDNVPGADASSTLVRLKSSIRIALETSGLDPLSPYTLWAVIFNRPEYCLGQPCGEGDLPISPGHDPRVEVSIVFAGGGVTDADGRGRFVGRVGEAHGRVIGDTLVGTGAFDTRRSEVHLVVRGHGYPAADEIFAALNSFGGGCSPDNACEDQQFAVHRGSKGVH